MVAEIVRTIESSDGKRKLEVFRREDGTYGFEDLKYGEEEETWFPAGRYSVGIFATEEDAIKEAKGRVQWMASTCHTRASWRARNPRDADL